MLDDFGSGLSSFNYLKHFPVDGIKIDGLFVKGIAKNYLDYALVESIHKIGTSLGLQTIAEYVETEEIARKLVQIGHPHRAGLLSCRRPSRGRRSSIAMLLYNSGLPKSKKTGPMHPIRILVAAAALAACVPAAHGGRQQAHSREPHRAMPGLPRHPRLEDRVSRGLPRAEARRAEVELHRGRAEGLHAAAIAISRRCTPSPPTSPMTRSTASRSTTAAIRARLRLPQRLLLPRPPLLLRPPRPDKK